MRIQFTRPGPVRRLVGPYEWSAAAGWVQEVDAATAAELLTQPPFGGQSGAEFAIAREEPLLTIQGIGEQRALELAVVAGVSTVADLAAWTPAQVKRWAAVMSVSKAQLSAWVAQARKLTEEVKLA